MIEVFEDHEHGGFYSSREGDASLVMRMKEDYDGAEPSGNSVAAGALLRLARATGREDLAGAAQRCLAFFSGKIATQGVTAPRMAAVLLESMQPPAQIVFAGPRGEAMDSLVKVIHARFLPHTSVLLAGDSPKSAQMLPVDGRPAVYVCVNFTCQLPVTNLEHLATLLSR